MPKTSKDKPIKAHKEPKLTQIKEFLPYPKDDTIDTQKGPNSSNINDLDSDKVIDTSKMEGPSRHSKGSYKRATKWRPRDIETTKTYRKRRKIGIHKAVEKFKKNKGSVYFPNQGKARLYKSAMELQAMISEYFENCPTKVFIVNKSSKNPITIEVPNPTITGLVLFLGFSNRNSFYKLEEQPEFKYTIQRARTFIEYEYEGLLKHGNPTGAIFALKQFGWKNSDQEEPEEQDEFKHLEALSAKELKERTKSIASRITKDS